jgi:putative endonuclease
MVTVYVIQSFKDSTWYAGMAKDVALRLKDHNSGRNRSAKGHFPWEIIYTEQHLSWTEARVREKYLKSAAGKVWLKKFLQQHGGKRGSLPA